MSMEFLNAAFKAPLTGATKAVLIVLADRTAFSGFCYPSLEDTAFRAGCSRRTAIRAISELETLGYLTVLRENGRLNKYVLSAEKLSTTRDTKSPVNHDNTSDRMSKSGDISAKTRDTLAYKPINPNNPNRAREKAGDTVAKSGKQKSAQGDRTVVTNRHAYSLFQQKLETRQADKTLVGNELSSIKIILAGRRH